jgi:hypothetical protein
VGISVDLVLGTLRTIIYVSRYLVPGYCASGIALETFLLNLLRQLRACLWSCCCNSSPLLQAFLEGVAPQFFIIVFLTITPYILFGAYAARTNGHLFLVNQMRMNALISLQPLGSLRGTGLTARWRGRYCASGSYFR